MGWFSGQSKAAKELERKRQQEKDEENAKRADDVCDEQKTPYQKKVRPVVWSHAIDFVAIARRRGSFLFEEEALRTASRESRPNAPEITKETTLMDVRRPRRTTTAARAQVIRKVGPYIENPDFTPKAIEKASVACKAICMRVSAF